MRILAITFLTGSAIIAANAFGKNNDGEKSSSLVIVDPVITGQTISGEELADWEQKRRKYLECPSCETKQPFPGN